MKYYVIYQYVGEIGKHYYHVKYDWVADKLKRQIDSQRDNREVQNEVV